MTPVQRAKLRNVALSAADAVRKYRREAMPVFIRRAGSEICGGCGKHIRDHYGGTEYRCSSRPLDLDIGDWELQTSNSFRRLGTKRGDGDVLCAVTHPSDGHPDLLAHPEVLDYIVATQPRVVLMFLDALDQLESELAQKL